MRLATLENTFAWSFTRSSIFRECRRKYWLNYYGSWGGWAQDAPIEIRRAYILKKLKNRWMWAGEKVHESIEGVLNDWRKKRARHSDQVIEQTVALMRREFHSSREGVYLNAPKTCALFEHHFKEEVEDRQWLRNRDKVVQCLNTFFESEWANQLQVMSQPDWLEVETFGRFQVAGYEVVVKLDVAHLFEDGVRVIDWKTGRTQGGDDDQSEALQLAMYARYAAQHWEVPSDRVWVVAANLFHNDGKSRLVTEQELAAAEAVVREDAAAMIAIMDGQDPQKNRVEQAACPMTENTQTCKRCVFKEVCWGQDWTRL
ncbi:MAG TPA: hypothetical protein EYN06_07760 [Myxococcales bacterium]|nr:hypothetical protein [Myxococcales bacterium]